MTQFKSLKYFSIATFDFGCSLTDETKRNRLINVVNSFFPSASARFEVYDDKLFDCEFIRFNEGKEPIVLENIHVKEVDKIIQEFRKSVKTRRETKELIKFFPSEIDHYVVLDSYGIGTLNVSFVAENIDVDSSIRVLKEFGRFVDSRLCPNYLIPQITLYLDSQFKDRSPVLREHHTYHVMVTNDAEKDKPTGKECYGLIWKDLKYEKANDKWVSDTVMNIAKESTDKMIIGNPAAFMSFKGVDLEKTFVGNHIMAVEVLRRQHHLLKRFDYQLSGIVRKDGSNTQEAIKQIVSMQNQIIELVDYFLKCKGFATEEFAGIVDEGIRVFRMADLYDNVKDKLDISYNTLNDLIQEERNRILYYLQIIGLFFASISFTTLILHPLLLRVYLKFPPFWPIQSMLGTLWIPLGDFACSAALTWLGYWFIRKRINKEKF